MIILYKDIFFCADNTNKKTVKSGQKEKLKKNKIFSKVL